MNSTECKKIAEERFEKYCGRLIVVEEFDYRHNGQNDVCRGLSIVQVITTTVVDICRWVDENLDPCWNVHPVCAPNLKVVPDECWLMTSLCELGKSHVEPPPVLLEEFLKASRMPTDGTVKVKRRGSNLVIDNLGPDPYPYTSIYNLKHFHTIDFHSDTVGFIDSGGGHITISQTNHQGVDLEQVKRVIEEIQEDL